MTLSVVASMSAIVSRLDARVTRIGAKAAVAVTIMASKILEEIQCFIVSNRICRDWKQ